MNTILQLTPHDPLIARDGRPFGAGQGNRMRGLPWPLPSVVAGSFRTALVKAGNGDFSGVMPTTLLEKVHVAGVFPVHGGELYLPAPNDYVWNQETNTRYRARPYDFANCCDFPTDGLRPVLFSDDFKIKDFKPAEVPAWWPAGKYAEWLLGNEVCFDSSFLRNPLQETRDHVCLDAERGAAAEGQIFATTGLNMTYLPRFGVKLDDKDISFNQRFAEVTLSARVTVPPTGFEQIDNFNILHPLGGERRLVHWQNADSDLWNPRKAICDALKTATQIRMVLATPAIFKHGWQPDLANGPLKAFNQKLVGVSNGRWKAVSGWSLAPPRGPKAIRRMVPAGSVYFFTCEAGAAAPLADMWLRSVSDDEQSQRDGFGLALWGTW